MVESYSVEQNEEEVKKETSRRERSTAYPSISLEAAINFVDKMGKTVGPGPHDRQIISEGLGYAGVSGTSASKIAALIHFGLIEKKAGKYRRTELAERLVFPASDGDRREAIIEAVKRPKVYGKLMERFKGQALPDLLKNILTREYKVSDKVSEGVVRDFRSSLEFAGILKDGVISANTQETIKVGEKVQIKMQSDPGPNHETNINEKFSSVILRSGLVIQFPERMTYEVFLRLAESIRSLESDAQERDEEAVQASAEELGEA